MGAVDPIARGVPFGMKFDTLGKGSTVLETLYEGSIEARRVFDTAAGPHRCTA